MDKIAPCYDTLSLCSKAAREASGYFRWSTQGWTHSELSKLSSPVWVTGGQKWSSGEAATALEKLLATAFMWSGYVTLGNRMRTLHSLALSAAKRPNK